jgi:hypothetical protein
LIKNELAGQGFKLEPVAKTKEDYGEGKNRKLWLKVDQMAFQNRLGMVMSAFIKLSGRTKATGQQIAQELKLDGGTRSQVLDETDINDGSWLAFKQDISRQGILNSEYQARSISLKANVQNVPVAVGSRGIMGASIEEYDKVTGGRREEIAKNELVKAVAAEINAQEVVLHGKTYQITQM